VLKNLKLLSVKEKMKIFKRIKMLRKSGLSYTKIVEKIKTEFDVKISKTTIIRWCKGQHKPAGYSQINLHPSPEFSYFLGALIGDGNVRRIIHNYKYETRLRVQDYDFAKTFAICVSKFLNKKIRIGKERDLTRCGERHLVAIYNKQLWEFLTSKSIKELIKIGKKFPTEFLRGIFDAEGFVSHKQVGLANTNLKLLKEVQYLLLEIFRIRSKIRLQIKKGKKVRIRGKLYSANKNVYILLLNRKDSKKFAKNIGFSIKRKQSKLEE